MYGMTDGNGANNYGSLFSINKDGSNYKTLWSFDDTGLIALNSNGSSPFGNVILIHNKLYGMTLDGGSNHYGEIFCINTDGTGYRDLWDFNDTGSLGNQNAVFPFGSLTLVGDKLIGVSNESHQGYGIAFSIDTMGHHFKDMHDFNGGVTGKYTYLGALAVSLSGTQLYGVTYDGGLYNDGMVYAIDTDGTHFKDLHDFDSTNGKDPYSSVILSGSKLFGMTYDGGRFNVGVMFTVDTAGHNFKKMVDFNDTNGSNPTGDLIYAGNKLYGMVNRGGAFMDGLIFSTDSTGNNFKDLADFNGINGEYPFGSLTLTGGDTLYGMTENGGANTNGNIFRFVNDTNINTGYSKLNSTGNIEVYPNPSNGNITVKTILDKSTIEIYNMLGEEVYSRFFVHRSSHIVDINNQPNGVYLLRVISDSGKPTSQTKLIIQK